jgi:hypothetical protein
LKKLIELTLVLGLVLLGAVQVRAEILPSFLTSAVDGPDSCRLDAAATSFRRPARRLPTKATCYALCPNGGTVSATCIGTCLAVDASCPGSSGYVVCKGVTTFCSSACPPDCQATDGTSCSPNGSTRQCNVPDGSHNTCTCRFGSWLCPY